MEIFEFSTPGPSLCVVSDISLIVASSHLAKTVSTSAEQPLRASQINLYGFIRLWRGKDRGGYYHEYFLRSRPHLLRFVRRIGKKTSGCRSRVNPDREPNFYDMSPMQAALTDPERKELREGSEPATLPVALPPFDPEVIRHATLQEVATQRQLQLQLHQLVRSSTLARSLNTAMPAVGSRGNVPLYRALNINHSLYEHMMGQQILSHHQMQQKQTLRRHLLQMQMQQRKVLQQQLLSLTSLPYSSANLAGVSACNSTMRGSSGAVLGAAVPSLWDTSTGTKRSDCIEDIANSSARAATGLDL
jgi:hypothetical protein